MTQPRHTEGATEAERDAFEAWMPSFWNHESFVDSDGYKIYCDDLVQGAWIGFKTGRAALSGWQPIETAPKIGTFLVYMPGERTQVQVAVWHPNVKVIGGSFAFDLSAPTHWMPTPPAPNQGAAS